MRTCFFLMLAMLAGLSFAGCGDDHSHDNNDDHHHEDDGNEHGHDHEGEHHDLGHMEHAGGWEIHAGHIGELEHGHEGIFEVKVTRNGKAVPGARVNAWIVDAEGKGLTPRAGGEWMADEGLFDCHLTMPEETPGDAFLMVRIREGDEDFTKKFSLGEIGHHD